MSELTAPAPALAPASAPPGRAIFKWSALLLTVATAIGLLVHRSHGHGGPAAAASPVVAFKPVTRQDLAQTLRLPGEFRAWQQVSVHAKVSGFLQSITVDVGDRVKDGEVLGQLEVPEIVSEQSKAAASVTAAEQDVAKAEATWGEAHAAWDRLRAVAEQHPRFVAEQDQDVARERAAGAGSTVAAAKGHLEAARAELGRVQSMLGYSTITAPFAGTVSKRFVDPGALIQAGIASSTQAMPLVELVQDDRLRLDFPVPESSVPMVKPGSTVKVHVGSLNLTFTAKVARLAGKVERATRTMFTEVDVPNPDGRFRPGMIAEVELVLQEHKDALAVPVDALLGGEHTAVWTIAADGTAAQRSVELGLQTPTLAEVTKGLSAGDRVIVGARHGLQPGQKVEARPLTALPE